MLFFTTYWLVNKTSLPLAVRRVVPKLAAGMTMHPEREGATSQADSQADFDEADEALLLESGTSGAAPRVTSPCVAVDYDPLEVNSGPHMVSYTRPAWEWPYNNASIKVQGDESGCEEERPFP